MVVGATEFASEVKLPAMNTRLRLGTTSMSKISPLLMIGVLARGLSGTRRVWPGPGSPGGPVGMVTVTVRVVVVDCSPWSSVTTREMVLVPEVVYVWVVVTPVPLVPSPKSQA